MLPPSGLVYKTTRGLLSFSLISYLWEVGLKVLASVSKPHDCFVTFFLKKIFSISCV